MFNIILIGPAGAGKGTQARLIHEQHGLAHLSTGDILRATIAAGGPLGEKLKATIEAGHLVDDATMIEIIRHRIEEPDCAAGFILDGFPRTEAQAEALDAMLAEKNMPLQTVIKLNVNFDELVERIVGRFTCKDCGEGYHDKFKQPAVAGVCDVCGSANFTRRADDAEEDAIRRRLQAYAEQTAQIVPYYEAKGILQRVDGMASITSVQEQIERVLQKVKKAA